MGASRGHDRSLPADSDFKPGTYWSEDLCTKLMQRAAQHGGKRVQLVRSRPQHSPCSAQNRPPPPFNDSRILPTLPAARRFAAAILCPLR